MYIHLIDDFSRVVLEAEKDKEGSDYINASYIDVRITECMYEYMYSTHTIMLIHVQSC